MKNNVVRQEFCRAELTDREVLDDPFALFTRWWDDAIAANVAVVDAMHLATIDQDGPDGRIVLLKDFDEHGFVFFTNYESAKGRQLLATPRAAITFFWRELERQIRVRGTVEKTSVEESRSYFAKRPRNAQIGAWSSSQSSVIKDRTILDEAYQRYATQFFGDHVPCPPHWGGFRLLPSYFEFWQGRESRLHDRICFTHDHHGHWHWQRLAP